jgi:hypothetical protein
MLGAEKGLEWRKHVLNAHIATNLPTSYSNKTSFGGFKLNAWCNLHVSFKYRYQKLHGLSPRANYTDWATAACRRSDCQLLRIYGGTWSAWRIPTAVFSVYRQKPLLFYQVAPQLYSRGWVDPVPDPLFFSGSAGNRTRASGSVAKNSDH